MPFNFLTLSTPKRYSGLLIFVHEIGLELTFIKYDKILYFFRPPGKAGPFSSSRFPGKQDNH